jgi:hypothetical protein
LEGVALIVPTPSLKNVTVVATLSPQYCAVTV